MSQYRVSSHSEPKDLPISSEKLYSLTMLPFLQDNPLSLEDGKTYITYDGALVTIVNVIVNLPSLLFEGSNATLYTQSGIVFRGFGETDPFNPGGRLFPFPIKDLVCEARFKSDEPEVKRSTKSED